MRIGTLVVWVVLAIGCTGPSPLQPDSSSSSAAPAAGKSALEASSDELPPSSLAQTFEGKAMPKNADNPSASDRKWDFTLYATPTSGQTGIAQVVASATFKKHQEKKAAPSTPIPSDTRCSSPTVWGANLVKLEWKQSYMDAAGSSLEGKAKNPSDWAVCTDGSAFHLKVEGEITKGEGKFENVKGGDWEATIDVSKICNPKGDWCPVDGNFEAKNLSYE